MVYIIISIMLIGLIIRVGNIGGGVDNNKSNRNSRDIMIIRLFILIKVQLLY